ncbi:Exostosin family protein [Klebsormidium nitens]|uniref:Exostosin family protein n=1 Tax=Klebsormidium nitens TaxID=105231 RepID=A0A1Y1I9M4_KLENI|nr:Exostosin family protein [Klebsormidium nitens]|eukprot:GAQ87674.1 Exostosin family protein [Klebsormidium nitens]
MENSKGCGSSTVWLSICLLLIASAAIVATYGYATVQVLKDSIPHSSLEATLSSLRSQLVRFDSHLAESEAGNPSYAERRKELLLEIQELRLELEARAELLGSNSSCRRSGRAQNTQGLGSPSSFEQSNEWCEIDAHESALRKPHPPELHLPKVFVYNLPSTFNRDMARKFSRCSTDQYGTEVWFHEAFLQSSARTTDPEEADFFFVPIYGECFLWFWEMHKKEGRQKSFDYTNQLFKVALNIVRKEHPYWNRTEGRDHIFSFPGARGPTIFSDWRTHIGKSIFLTPEGDRTIDYFNTWKDIVIPGMESDPVFYLPSSRAAISKEKDLLAYFRGTIDHWEGNAYSKGIRPRIRDLLQNETDIIFKQASSDCDRECYHREMSRANFCLCPLGWTPWTLRFYQAVMTRCIPVVVADDIEFPWENEIDYSRFAIKVPEAKIDTLVELMRGMPEEERELRRLEMDKVWLKYTYQRPPREGDAFHMLLRELARKTRRFKHSSQYTWT